MFLQFLFLLLLLMVLFSENFGFWPPPLSRQSLLVSALATAIGFTNHSQGFSCSKHILKAFVKRSALLIQYCSQGPLETISPYPIPSPLMFILLNDIESNLKLCNKILYADETVLFYAGKTSTEIENVLGSELEQIARWLNENNLVINLKKSKTGCVLYGTHQKHLSWPHL